MSETVSKIPFDEYYEMLKEFVEDPEARRRLEAVDVEVKRYYDEGGRLDYPREEDGGVYNAQILFEHVGFKILERRGWGNYRHIAEIGKPYDLSQAMGFCGVSEVLLRGKLPDWEGEDAVPCIRDKEQVRRFLKARIARRSRMMSAYSEGFPINFGDNHD